MNYQSDRSLLLKMQISLSQLREDFQVCNHSHDTGILSYVERSLNTLISQLSERTQHQEILPYFREEFTI